MDFLGTLTIFGVMAAIVAVGSWLFVRTVTSKEYRDADHSGGHNHYKKLF